MPRSSAISASLSADLPQQMRRARARASWPNSISAASARSCRRPRPSSPTPERGNEPGRCRQATTRRRCFKRALARDGAAPSPTRRLRGDLRPPTRPARRRRSAVAPAACRAATCRRRVASRARPGRCRGAAPRYHDDAIHAARAEGQAARAVYDAVEQARVEAIGAAYGGRRAPISRPRSTSAIAAGP